MPLNLTKQYSDLLEISHLNEQERTLSLRRIFDRDIANNPNFRFRAKEIHPLKSAGEINMEQLFAHLTTHTEVIVDEQTGKERKRRSFEPDRSLRLHWILHHIEERKPELLTIFSTEERDIKHRQTIVRTYIYDKTQKYVIVLEPQRNRNNYYLLTAYYLNRPEGLKKIGKLQKHKLADVL